MPNILVVRQKLVLAHAGIDIAKVLPGAHDRDPLKWSIATPVNDKDQAVESIRFFRSISQAVDDEEKKANFAVMVNSAFHAGDYDDFTTAMSASTVTAKLAHKFSFQGKNHQLFELKRGKKDRVYYYPLSLKDNVKFILLLLAHHKNTNTTPQDIKDYAETQIKSFIKIGAEVNIFKRASK